MCRLRRATLLDRDDPAFGGEEGHGVVVLFVGDVGDELGAVADADGGDGGDFGEETVVVSFAMAEAIAFGVEGEAGDENEI